MAQLVPTKRTPVALPPISAGVSKNKHQIWRRVGTSTGVRCSPPLSFLRGRFVKIGENRCSTTRVSRRSPKILAEQVQALCAVRQPQPPLLGKCGVRRVREDWFHEGSLVPDRPDCFAHDSTGRRASAHGRERDGAFASRRAARGERSRRTVESAVGPVPRKEALFH